MDVKGHTHYSSNFTCSSCLVKSLLGVLLFVVCNTENRDSNSEDHSEQNDEEDFNVRHAWFRVFTSFSGRFEC